jgi:hypothetical protein
MVAAAQTDRMARLVTESTAGMDTRVDIQAVRRETLVMPDASLLESMIIILPVTVLDAEVAMARLVIVVQSVATGLLMDMGPLVVTAQIPATGRLGVMGPPVVMVQIKATVRLAVLALMAVTAHPWVMERTANFPVRTEEHPMVV